MSCICSLHRSSVCSPRSLFVSFHQGCLEHWGVKTLPGNCLLLVRKIWQRGKPCLLSKLKRLTFHSPGNVQNPYSEIDSLEVHWLIGVPMVPLVVQISALSLIWKDTLLTSADWMDTGSTIYSLLWLLQMVVAVMYDQVYEFIAITNQIAYHGKCRTIHSSVQMETFGL